eukprot:SAG22_NODE_7332_length_750_cov_1.815668_2_plen_115_part_01
MVLSPSPLTAADPARLGNRSIHSPFPSSPSLVRTIGLNSVCCSVALCQTALRDVWGTKDLCGPKFVLPRHMGLSILGIVPFRAVFFGVLDTMNEVNPYGRDDRRAIRIGSHFLCA